MNYINFAAYLTEPLGEFNAVIFGNLLYTLYHITLGQFYLEQNREGKRGKEHLIALIKFQGTQQIQSH